MDTHFCLEMLDEALGQGIPEILNTDQGSQFTSHDWISRVKGAGVLVSMDGKGRWVNNVIIERFWRTIKHEHVLLHSYEDLRQARRSIGDFINLYNHKRLYQSLRYHTPAEVYGVGLQASRKLLKSQFFCPDGRVDNLKNAKLPTSPQAQQPGLIF
ncbi:IS3 family transposase domain protein [Candidatus Bealeia paramacronuclearis]|uniref:IS3 family transposase domain protein n=2 Tax=Candidatus Bealeia paramacronuclearis TaxID=1921001 RepID=A0ABZ2C5K3_9PROT|nr:IS3 family transposase domain protein [Candidatus Bealeia paramacronuclearis]